MKRDLTPPVSVDLYRHHNGELVIRELKKDGDTSKGPPWTATRSHTRVEARARKVLAKYIAKRKITGIDAETVPLVDRFAEQRHNGKVPVKTNGHAPSKWGGPLKKAHAPRPIPRKTETAQRLVQVIGQSLASAATALRLLGEELGEPPDTD